jgi:hypothetical protein
VVSKKLRTFAVDLKKSPAKMGFASAKNKFSAFGSHHHCTRFQKEGA